MNVWEPRRISTDQCLHWQIGPLKIWIRRVDDELHIAKENAPNDDETLVVAESWSEFEGKEADWKRWVVGARDNVIRFLPIMPDCPVIVRPETDIVIPKGDEALFFVGIPVSVRITAGENEPVVLWEIPTVRLSKSWFGDALSGEVCYALRTTARRSLDRLPARPNRAVCPVKNAAKEELDFQRLCLRVDHLNVFGGPSHLWTNQVNVTYRGQEQLSQVDFVEGPPPMSGAARLISQSRLPATQGILRKSFSTLRTFSGL